MFKFFESVLYNFETIRLLGSTSGQTAAMLQNF